MEFIMTWLAIHIFFGVPICLVRLMSISDNSKPKRWDIALAIIFPVLTLLLALTAILVYGVIWLIEKIPQKWIDWWNTEIK